MKLNKQIREHRKKIGLTQEQVAGYLGVSGSQQVGERCHLPRYHTFISVGQTAEDRSEHIVYFSRRFIQGGDCRFLQ